MSTIEYELTERSFLKNDESQRRKEHLQMQQRRRLRRFQLRLPRRQLHLHGRNDQRRSQLRNFLHRHGLRYVQTEERRITPLKNTPQGVFFIFGRKRSALSKRDQLFLFERKSCKKNQKTCRFIALSVQIKARKNAPLPARDFRSSLTKIRRNREAKYRFTGFLRSANRAKGAKSFNFGHAPFCREIKICKSQKCAVVPSNFCEHRS